MRYFFACFLICGIVACALAGHADEPAEKPASSPIPPVGADGKSEGTDAAAYVQESIRGQVVWLADVLKRRFGIESDPDVAEAYVALEATDGRILPLVKDDRGRGFWKDKRIRGIPVELYVRRYEGSPMVQVIRVYTIKDGKKYEFDYWCDICAIPMYELKQCECCQGPIRIRERLVEPTAADKTPSSGGVSPPAATGGSR